MTAALDTLSPARRAEVLAAVRAVEEADRPVPRNAFRALTDETLRASVEHLLAAAGRVLLERPAGFLSGYDDRIANALATEGVGVLPPADRAVLTLVLLYAVAIPRARGTVPADADWTVAEAVDPRTLKDSKLPDVLVQAAVRRLRDAGVLAYGRHRWIVPGSQFARLTPAAVSSLYEELVLLAEPEGLLAESIRRRRTARRQTTQPERPPLAQPDEETP